MAKKHPVIAALKTVLKKYENSPADKKADMSAAKKMVKMEEKKRK